MHEMQIIQQAKEGTVVPVVHTETNDETRCAIEYFAKLSDYGRKANCILLESADIVPKYGENSIGTADPCLKITGRGDEFRIRSLNGLGRRFCEFLDGSFDFADVEYGKTIRGTLRPQRESVSEEERLKLITHADILRAVAFRFRPTVKPFVPYCGLFGTISYDFIDQFEDLPKNKADTLDAPDYEMFYCDNLFLINHKEKKTHFIANALIMDDDRDAAYERCTRVIESYRKTIHRRMPGKHPYKNTPPRPKSDTTKAEYEAIVSRIKRHIVAGDVFQAVPSRTIVSGYNSEPLDIYRRLRSLNPSPYMFYVNSETILIGASPEMAIRVTGDREKTVEMRPIAGTKPRGIIKGKIDRDLDSRYETELKIDEKELAEHVMLVDLARNDVAKISIPGTRVVDEPFVVEKYSHVQHLVSNIRGTLKPGYDALHAYLATMNMGTVTGAPKVEAMKLIRNLEKSKRGFYGGTVGYLTPSGDMDSAIVIRTMCLKGGRAYIRAGAGVVYDSSPESEYLETEKKAGACLKALGAEK
ncbi:MAG: anthranilate synthase component 1 [archaeon]